MELNIRENWHRLSPETRQWFTNNPGCLILPRTLVSTIRAETGASPAADQHGETTLSPEDSDFLRNKARTRDTEGEPRFFDATQP